MLRWEEIEDTVQIWVRLSSLSPGLVSFALSEALCPLPPIPHVQKALNLGQNLLTYAFFAFRYFFLL